MTIVWEIFELNAFRVLQEQQIDGPYYWFHANLFALITKEYPKFFADYQHGQRSFDIKQGCNLAFAYSAFSEQTNLLLYIIQKIGATIVLQFF